MMVGVRCHRKIIKRFLRRSPEWVATPYRCDFENFTVNTNVTTPGYWPPGMAITGEWGFPFRVVTGGVTGNYGRFPTTGENNGSANSSFTIWMTVPNTTLKQYGIFPEFRDVKYIFNPTGGFQYRTSGAGYYNNSTMLAPGDGTNMNRICIETPTSVSLIRHNQASAFNTSTPLATMDTTGYMAAGWHKVETRMRCTKDGYCMVIWDNAVKMHYSGDLSVDWRVAGQLTYFGHPGGYTSSSTDAVYFGGIDNFQLYKRA